jgi:hypothetical protein
MDRDINSCGCRHMGRPSRRGSHRGRAYDQPCAKAQAPYNPIGVFAAHLPSWQRKMRDIAAEEREFVNSQDGHSDDNAGDLRWLAGLIAGLVLISWIK